ncbi:6125_t:CDS:2 [Acaulospora morrowiae]|uniref:6125_t:CDS:1 n=1 Tax=Acaulospora morrowiae TaxID=94023 RepID=A0A9N9ALH6_9GLOM|nr:6125_t:CDS:2 [Acaulospora morrowiae]
MVIHENEVYSQVMGYISIACWVVFSIPQIYENYKRKSGESLSIIFLYIWCAGDFLNLMGSLFQHLLPTVIILAVYYNIVDIMLISQVYYYRLRRSNYEEIVCEYGTFESQSPPSPPPPRPKSKKFIEIAIGIFAVCLTGVIAYYFSSRSQEVKNNKDLVPLLFVQREHLELFPQVCGWISTLLYLGSRIPQIIKNYTTKSTEGLSLAMFCYAVLGNITFCLSIILNSTDYEYLIINFAWLLGSGGTLIFDFIIFAQFYMYGR